MGPLSWLAMGAIVGALAYSAWRKAPLSLTVALAVMVVFFLDYLSQTVASLGPPVFVDLAWIYVPSPVPYVSPPWTVVTTMFVHAGLFHLMFNLLGFLLIMPILEERIGSLRWALAFFLGGMFGQGLFWILHAGEPFILVGASGGLMALFGAFARLYPRERVSLFLLFMPAIPIAWLAIGFLVFSFALASLSPGGIAHEAHIGGIIFGFLAIPLFMRLEVRRAAAKLAVPDPASLEPLATTRELRQILDELKAADVPEVQAAWLEKFSATARCPRCGGPLRRRMGALTSPCGWRLRL